MTGKGIVFTDVDGTLVFHKKFHAIQELQTYPDGTISVQDPITGYQTRTLDVSVPPIVVYLAESTRRLANQVREKYRIFFTTGASVSTMRVRRKNLDFADGYILEHGGMIVDAEFNEDPLWAERFQPYLETLDEIERSLIRADWQIMDVGRKTFLQVKSFENPHRTQAEFQLLCDTLELPEGFEKTFNLGNLTIIPETSGKGKAVAYMLDQDTELASRSVGIGDDLNDLDFLHECQRAYVLGSGLPEVIQQAHQRGWYVSSKPHFQGIDEILTEILNLG